MATAVNFVKNRDNDARLTLFESGNSTPLSGITQLQFYIGDEVLDSDTLAGRFDWDTYANSREVAVALQSGDLDDVDAGFYSECELYVFDASHTNGYLWGTIDVNVEVLH